MSWVVDEAPSKTSRLSGRSKVAKWVEIISGVSRPNSSRLVLEGDQVDMLYFKILTMNKYHDCNYIMVR